MSQTYTKTVQERLAECLEIRKRLVELQLDHLEDFDEMKKAMSDFVKHAKCATGSTLSRSLGRNIIYQLSNTPGEDSYCKLTVA